MAQVDIEEVIDHLSSEMRKALVIAVNDVIPDADYDERQLFKAFRKAVRRKCNTWEQVPDQYVRD
jgi:dephospho-CoA kinase